MVAKEYENKTQEIVSTHQVNIECEVTFIVYSGPQKIFTLQFSSQLFLTLNFSELWQSLVGDQQHITRTENSPKNAKQPLHNLKY